MLILGLIVGPPLGLVAGHYLKRFSGAELRWATGLMIVACLALAFVVHVSTEAKVGLITGLSLGLLLSGSQDDCESAMVIPLAEQRH